MSIKLINVSKKYKRKNILNDVCFEVLENQVVGLLGLNGAGKSTLMKIMVGIMPPTSGEICLFDKPVDYTKSEFKHLIGYLSDRNPLYPDMYIREYLQFCSAFYHLPKERVDEVIALTSLEGELQKRLKELSRGYLQRVGLAAAIIHKPKLLILDEPTSGIDLDQLFTIRQLIKNIGQSSIVILSTHIIEEIKEVCDRVLILREGRIVSDQSAKNIHINTLLEKMKSSNNQKDGSN